MGAGVSRRRGAEGPLFPRKRQKIWAAPAATQLGRARQQNLSTHAHRHTRSNSHHIQPRMHTCTLTRTHAHTLRTSTCCPTVSRTPARSCITPASPAAASSSLGSCRGGYLSCAGGRVRGTGTLCSVACLECSMGAGQLWRANRGCYKRWPMMNGGPRGPPHPPPGCGTA